MQTTTGRVVIASYTNSFIFLKTRKTGGTSMAIVLSTWCTTPDVASPLYKPDEEIRLDLGGCPSTTTWNGKKIHSHLTAAEVRGTFPDLWAAAYKFSIERHPYEKVVSRAYWEIGRRNGRADEEIADALDAAIECDQLIDRDIYCIDGKIVADRVFLHSDLTPAIQELATRFGKPVPSLIPRAKGNFRLDRRPAAEILSERQKRRIRERTQFEFETFSFQP